MADFLMISVEQLILKEPSVLGPEERLPACRKHVVRSKTHSVKTNEAVAALRR